MKELRDSINKVDEKYILIFLLVMSAFMRIMHLYMNQGISYGGDVQRYSLWATQIHDNGFSYYTDNIDKPYYWGYCTILYVCRYFLCGDYSAIILNAVVSAAGVYFLYKIAFYVTENRCISAFAGLVYCWFPQLFSWNNELTSESMGVFFGLVCFYLYFRQKSESGSKKRRTIIILFVCMVLFYLVRTTAVITIGFILIGLIRQLDRKKRVVIFSLLASVVITIFVLMLIFSRGEHGVISRIKYYISLYESGTIVFETNTFVYPVHTDFIGNWKFIFDVVGIILCRFVFFWAISFDYYTIVDNILAYGFLLPLFITGFGGIIFAQKNKMTKLYPIITFILLTNIIQSLFEIDAAYRYRFPVLPHLIILSSYFFYCVTKHYYKSKQHKLT